MVIFFVWNNGGEEEEEEDWHAAAVDQPERGRHLLKQTNKEEDEICVFSISFLNLFYFIFFILFICLCIKSFLNIFLDS
jgi:hypothetical protein